MKNVTLALAYYENPTMLIVQLDELARNTVDVRDHARLIIVDDCSPRHPIDVETVVSRCTIPVQLYRMGVDVRWNQDACRNIAMHHVDTDWVILTDMDHVVSRDAWNACVRGSHDPRVAFTFRRVKAPDGEAYKPHPNSWFMHRSVYEKVGGYDERLSGLYGTDGDFRKRVEQVARIMQMHHPLTLYGRSIITDASTVGFTRQSIEDNRRKKDIVSRRDAAGQRPLRLTFPYERLV